MIIPSVDSFKAKEVGILARNLYVAMTRARSILTIFAHRSTNSESQTLFRAIETCLDYLHNHPRLDSHTSIHDDITDILDIIGEEHRKWLQGLWSQYELSQEPLLTEDNELIAEPLFWLKHDGKIIACFGNKIPRQRTIENLVDQGIGVLKVGEEVVQ